MRLIRLLKRDIAREAAEWVDEGLIAESQAEKICQRYDIDYHQAGNRSFAYAILVGLAALFVGLALITLIGGNWEDIPRSLRMGGLILLTVTTQGLALRKHLAGKQATADWLFLLGNLFYGASIILIAQIYHLGEHMPDGIFWWALGCLPFGVLLRSPWLTLQSLILALIWFFMEAGLGFYPALLPLFLAGSLFVLYRGRQSILLFLTTVGGIGCWAEYSLAELWRDGRQFDFHAEHIAVSTAMFITAYVFSHWLARRPGNNTKDYGAVLAVWSLRFGLIFMLVMSFAEPWRELIRAHWDQQLSMFGVVVSLAALSMVLAVKVGRAGLVAGLLGFYLLTLLAVISSGDTSHAVYFQVVYNLVLIGVGIWLNIRGIHDGISHYFFLGVTAILLTAFMRYIDLIGDYMGGALLFMLFAALLFGAAKYWQRQQMTGGVR